MQWFCHPALRQIQGLSFISLCSECSRLHGNHKFPLMLPVCVFHTDSIHGFQEIYQINPLFIHVINYKAKSNCFASNCVTLFYCLVSVYIYKKMSVCMYRQSIEQRVTYLDVVI